MFRSYLRRQNRCIVALGSNANCFVGNRAQLLTLQLSSQISGKSVTTNNYCHFFLNGYNRTYRSYSTKTGSKMARVTEKVTMNYPRRKVWTVLSDFGNLEWQHQTIDSVDMEGNKEGIGMIRVINIKGISHPIKEKLVTMDDNNFNFSIEVNHSWILPFGDYTCECQIEKIDDKTCNIMWTGEFEVLGMAEEEGAKLASAIYKQMFRDLPGYMHKKGY